MTEKQITWFSFNKWHRARRLLLENLHSHPYDVIKLVNNFFENYIFEFGSTYCVSRDAVEYGIPEDFQGHIDGLVASRIGISLLEKGFISREKIKDDEGNIEYTYRCLCVGTPLVVAGNYHKQKARMKAIK